MSMSCNLGPVQVTEGSAQLSERGENSREGGDRKCQQGRRENEAGYHTGQGLGEAVHATVTLPRRASTKELRSFPGQNSTLTVGGGLASLVTFFFPFIFFFSMLG